MDACFKDGSSLFPKEVEYFTEQVALFADLCAGRNFTCSNEIRTRFPVSVFPRYIWNQDLAPSLRAAFVRLFQSLYVDSYPREEAQKPALCRTLDQMDSNPTNIRRDVQRRLSLKFAEVRSLRRRERPGISRQSSVMDSSVLLQPDSPDLDPLELWVGPEEETLFDLKERLIENLQTMSADPKGEISELNVDLVRLALQLARFGLYGTCCTLEARHCLLSPAHPSFTPHNMDLVRLARAISPLLQSNTSLKSQVTKRRSQSIYNTVLAQVLRNPASMADSIVRASVAMRNLLNSYTLETEEIKPLDLELKQEVADFYHYLVDFRLDALVNCALERFAHSAVVDAARLFPPVMACVDSSGKPIKTIKVTPGEVKVILSDLDETLGRNGTFTAELLSDLVETTDFALQTKLIHLLTRCYSQRSEMLKTLSQIFVVSSESDVSVFHWLRLLLPRLKQQTEQSEIWLKYEEQTGVQRHESEETLVAVIHAFKQLNDLLLVDSDIEGETVFTKSEEISPIRQGILYHLRAHTIVLNLLKDSLSEVEEARPENSQLQLLFTSCHVFLARFAQGNARNQEALFDHMHLFTSCLALDLQQIPLICAVYADNVDICLKVTEDTLQPFVQAIKQEGRQARFLDIFSVIQVVNGHAVPSNQSLVLKILLGSARLVLLYLNPSDPIEFLFTREKPQDEPYTYQAKLLSVLARCGWGSEQVYLNEVKLQKFLDMRRLFDLLRRSQDESEWLPLRLPLLEFLYHIYLETQKGTDELVGNTEFLAFVRRQTQQLYQESPDPYFLEILLHIMLLYSRNYLSQGEEEVFQDQDSITVLKSFALAIERLTRKSPQQHLSLQQATLVTSFLDLFALKPDSTWLHSRAPSALQHTPNLCLLHWQEFGQTLSQTSEIHQGVAEEKQHFLRILMQADLLKPGLSFAAVIRKYIGYLNAAPLHPTPPEVFQAVVETLQGCIRYVKRGHRETQEEAMSRMQEELAAYSICSEVLGILCFHEYLPEPFRLAALLAIDLLEGGNEHIQLEFYLYFVNVPAAELFFQRVHKLLISEANLLGANESREPPVWLTPLLRLLQLLCEGHNRDLQQLLRTQTHSRRSFDLVSLCVSLLEVLIKRLRACDFLVTSQCLDSLTEFVQGPCQENQACIIAGSFLDSAVALLGLDEQGKGQQYEDLETQQTPNQSNDPLKSFMVAQLKMKCMITVHSLLEGHQDPFILSRLQRALHLQLLTSNINHFFSYFEVDHPVDAYEEDMFGQAGKEQGLLLETPFLMFHLMKKFHDLADPDRRQRIQEEVPSADFDRKVVGTFGRLGMNIWKGLTIVTKLSKPQKTQVLPEAKPQHLDTKRIYKYLEHHTGNVEVRFNGRLVRVYFPLPAYASVLSSEMMEDFHAGVDRSSLKTKLVYLQEKARDVNIQLRCEYYLQRFVSRHSLVALIAHNVRLWRDIGTFLTLLLNFLILCSYSGYSTDRINQPSFLYLESGSEVGLSSLSTHRVFEGLGVLQIFCTFFVVLSFLSKTSPLLAFHGWTKVHRPLQRPTRMLAMWVVTKRLFWVLIYVFSDGRVLYYLACMVLSCLGVATSPLFFSFHLTELLLRFSALQHVVQAVIRPWRRTFLVYIMMLVLIYYFGIVAYAYLEGYFSLNADTLLVTTITVYDAGFKNNGFIGGSLADWPDGSIEWTRLIFDDLGNILILLIVLNVWAGLTKDSFTAIREQHEQDRNDRLSICFICGLDKEKLERATKHPFETHRQLAHNEWSYMLFLGYLNAKDSTEFTGVESYVWDQYEKKDLQWLPRLEALDVQADYSTLLEVTQRRRHFCRQLGSVNDTLREVRQRLSA